MSSFYSIPGPAGTIQIGTVTTGAEGTNVAVTNTGTAESAILNFQIPRGNTGTISTVVAGSASSPSIFFTGDPNTGIYSPGADQVAISTGGSGRLFVDASGQVGMGTSSPGGLLHVQNNLAGNNQLILTNIASSNSGAGSEIVFTQGASGFAAGKIQCDREGSYSATTTSQDSALAFFTAADGVDSEKLRITSAGLVGIGTSAPTGGGLNISSNSANALVLQRTSATSGIDQTVQTLRFLNGAAGSNYSADISCYQGTAFPDAVGLQFKTKSGGIADPITRMTINGSGNVGIGISSPSQEVDIFADKNGLTTTWVRNPNTGASAGARLLVGSHLGDVSLVAYSAANTAFGGSAAVLSSSSAFTGGLNLFAGGAAPLVFWTNSNERARIDSSGRLLIGTGTDSGGALLQVNGNRIRIATAKTPASATDTGVTGEICWDANYVYVCTATNTWKRTTLATW